MVKNADDKRNKILEAAKRRFSHYGMAKTTMSEIAKDLSFSKALLYYYFPDKNSLYAAVLEYIIDEFNEEVRPHFEKVVSVEESLSLILELRILFTKRYYYIVEFTFVTLKDVPQELEAVLVHSNDYYFNSIKSVFQKGVDSGELNEMDVDECAKLFFYSTMGMRMIAMKDLKTQFVPAKEDFEHILDMQKKLTKIFVRSLKK